MTASWQDRSTPNPSTRLVAAVWIVVLLMVAVSCLAVARPAGEPCDQPSAACEHGGEP